MYFVKSGSSAAVVESSILATSGQPWSFIADRKPDDHDLAAIQLSLRVNWLGRGVVYELLKVEMPVSGCIWSWGTFYGYALYFTSHLWPTVILLIRTAILRKRKGKVYNCVSFGSGCRGLVFELADSVLIFYEIMAKVRNSSRRVFVNKYINFWEEGFLGGPRVRAAR